MPVTGGRVTPEVAAPVGVAGAEVVAWPEEAILALRWAALWRAASSTARWSFSTPEPPDAPRAAGVTTPEVKVHGVHEGFQPYCSLFRGCDVWEEYVHDGNFAV